MRFVLIAAAALSLPACLTSLIDEDGGRRLVNCPNQQQLTVPVKLLKPDGEIWPGAILKAEYLSNDEVVEYTANWSGIAVVEDLGPGVVRLTSDYEDHRLSAPAEITFVGDECATAVNPTQLTLTLVQ